MSLARFQLPYLTTAQRELITITNKDLVYDTDLMQIFVGDGVTAGGVLVSATGMWEADGLTTIKPMDGKTVDASHISGEVDGGIFQP